MSRFKPFYALIALILLSACAEAELASHAYKKTFVPPVTKSQGSFKVGSPYTIQGRQYVPVERYSHSETGIASWYGPGFHGKRTANGEIFNKNELTAAHKTLQMPSLVRVTNLNNGRSIIVRVNDRGPYSRGRVIDLSEKAAELIGMKHAGTAKVRIDVLPEESRKVAELAKQGHSTRGYEIALNKAPPTRTPGPVPTHAETRATYQSASVAPVESEKLGAVPVHQGQGGVVYPDPVVRQTPVGPSNIFVQAGSFSSEANANALRDRLKAIGPANVTLTRVNGRPFYRVRLGPYARVATADTALSRTLQSGIDGAVIVID